jgi:hypothetical protein
LTGAHEYKTTVNWKLSVNCVFVSVTLIATTIVDGVATEVSMATFEFIKIETKLLVPV